MQTENLKGKYSYQAAAANINFFLHSGLFQCPAAGEIFLYINFIQFFQLLLTEDSAGGTLEIDVSDRSQTKSNSEYSGLEKNSE
ncbi:MAG: hypothetical protein LKE59_09395 [Eubacterium sp.]|jgi:hypothetical protein|nr:hypothetical protein [Eubacterium sp.]MCH4078365.1 hypothetical protein [Eubacterium sp.]MCI1405078.1 hypothetical protein [Eubacterium sp.]